jgi:Fe2+ or Zn2+ uptake regulation protein
MVVITITGGATVESLTKLRATAQRNAILEAVRRSDDHPTAEQVYQRARRRLRSISLGTVYRNLAFLDRLGAVRRVDLNGEPARFDGEVTPHHHVRCSRCGRIDDVELPVGNEMPEWVSAKTGYCVTDYRVQFTGLCPDCIGTEAC